MNLINLHIDSSLIAVTSQNHHSVAERQKNEFGLSLDEMANQNAVETD
jgi:hypothetical protein